jgi:hypothetical protein
VRSEHHPYRLRRDQCLERFYCAVAFHQRTGLGGNSRVPHPSPADDFRIGNPIPAADFRVLKPIPDRDFESGTPSPQLTLGSRTATQQARPYRPNSVLGVLFPNTLHPPECVPVAAGSSDTNFTIQTFVERPLCFRGLSTSVPSTLMITTPEGVRETMTLTSFYSIWDGILFPVPGQGLEAQHHRLRGRADWRALRGSGVS